LFFISVGVCPTADGSSQEAIAKLKPVKIAVSKGDESLDMWIWVVKILVGLLLLVVIAGSALFGYICFKAQARKWSAACFGLVALCFALMYLLVVGEVAIVLIIAAVTVPVFLAGVILSHEDDSEKKAPVVLSHWDETTCKDCGAIMPKNSKFCRECGSSQQGEIVKKCGNCGAIMPKGAKFCGKCGAELGI
jgi:RNA polymerase subunit RPABC4/transcription elongation factor Spt4